MSAYHDDIEPVDVDARGSGAEVLIISLPFLTRGPGGKKYRLVLVFITKEHGGNEPPRPVSRFGWDGASTPRIAIPFGLLPMDPGRVEGWIVAELLTEL